VSNMEMAERKETMINTFLHILPGVDDEPQTTEESVALARVLMQEGIHMAIATPHFNDLFPLHSVVEIQERVNDLQQELDCHHIPLRLFAGHEALIKPGLVEDIQAGRLATLNSIRYLLLEWWDSFWLPQTEQVIFELRAFGIVLIIAHPERYCAIQQGPNRLVTLLRQGALTQLTASGLVDMWGKTTRCCAETLLKIGLIHCVASDTYGVHNAHQMLFTTCNVLWSCLVKHVSIRWLRRGRQQSSTMIGV
jgi:protein-tyrosine phosphatase